MMMGRMVIRVAERALSGLEERGKLGSWNAAAREINVLGRCAVGGWD